MNNKNYIAPDEIITDIAKLSEAILFGSRSMASRPVVDTFDPSYSIGAQITKTTDWDFSAQYSKENHDSLIASGFTYFSPEVLNYKDDLATGVYIKTYTKPFDMNNLTIEEMNSDPVANVVLRSDHNLFCQVWNSIDAKFYYEFLWKRGPSYFDEDLGLTKSIIRDILNQLFRTAKHMI